MRGYDVERIITRQKQSGMHHLRLKVNGHFYTQEQDNLDDAVGGYEIVPDLPEDIESALFCKLCFPQLHDPRPTNVEGD